MSPRPYRMQQRRVGIDATRAKILSAARAVLSSGDTFSIEAVAREAGVARLTIYDRFATREGLVDAVFDDLAESGGLTNLPDAFSRADPVDALEHFVVIFCGFYSTHRTLLRRLNALTVLGRGAPGHRDRNPRRRQGLGVLLARLQDAGYAGAGAPEVLHAVHTLTSFAFVDEFAGSDSDPTAVAPALMVLVRDVVHLG